MNTFVNLGAFKISAGRVGMGIVAWMVLVGSLGGCTTIRFGPAYDAPLKEQVIEEAPAATGKVLLLEVHGKISDESKGGLLSKGPSLLDSVLMQLKKAREDKAIKALLLKIDSPGGGVTASDILYHELMAYKADTGAKIYVQMMDVAASGGYYIALAGDHIQAHPTTVTGSIGVISVSPDLSQAMDKLGVGVNVYKSGASKDMGSPFRAANPTDQVLFQKLIADMAARFYGLVEERRGLNEAQMRQIKSARIYSGAAAKEAGLVDSLGYLSDATQQACELAGEKRCEVIGYRFTKNPNASIYSPSAAEMVSSPNALLQVPLLESALQLTPGIYYLYQP